MAAIETDAEPTKILEFGLGDETYCLDISIIDEIVDAGELTRIPNSPTRVEGVMDLRGRTTTIVDPKTVFGIDEPGSGDRIVVFDEDHLEDSGTIGWIVDEVYQVRDVAPAAVDERTTADDAGVNGIVKSDDRFVVWVTPDAAVEAADAADAVA